MWTMNSVGRHLSCEILVTVVQLSPNFVEGFVQSVFDRVVELMAEEC